MPDGAVRSRGRRDYRSSPSRYSADPQRQGGQALEASCQMTTSDMDRPQIVCCRSNAAGGLRVHSTRIAPAASIASMARVVSPHFSSTPRHPANTTRVR
ncbi:MAG: hypothetical protein KatS3mg111_2354 [Pirellulaceae bacterium]|nr:MAG: hypothetical protein KatS3mg111_2354 [Pirellulaceae bacterium]